MNAETFSADMDKAIRSITRPVVPIRAEDAEGKVDTDSRTCTCHPYDNPPVPCPRMFALSECRAAAAATFEQSFSNLPTGFLRVIRRAAERYGCEPLWTAVEDSHDACTGG